MPLERDLRTVRLKADTTGGNDADAGVMVYACGPEPMLAAVARLAAAHGRQSQVSVERVMGPTFFRRVASP